jgi:hypothetical protein
MRNEHWAADGQGPGGENSLSGSYGLNPMRAQRISRSNLRDSRVQALPDRSRQREPRHDVDDALTSTINEA